MIIYRGAGLVVPVFVGAGVLAASFAAKRYDLDQTAALYVGCGIGAVLCAVIGTWINSSKRDRHLIDSFTDERYVLQSRHSLFFIQVQYWALIILGFAGVAFYTDIQSGAIDPDHIEDTVRGWFSTGPKVQAVSNDFKNGYEAYRNKQYTDAQAAFLLAANHEDASAQYYLGVMSRDGLGVPKDYGKALDWFVKAGEQGDPYSQTNVGLFYVNAWGTQQDYQKAIIWFRKAAERGLPDAQYNLGVMYSKGEGVEQDANEAAKWFGKAAGQGNEQAKHALAEIKSDVVTDTKPDSALRAAAAVLLNNLAHNNFAYTSGKINVVFKDAAPGQFQKGNATTCGLIVNIHNNSKYHLNSVSFNIDDWSFEIDEEMNANTIIDDYAIRTISLTNGAFCSDQAAFINNSIKKAAIFDCSIPNLAEGDCQDLVAVTSQIDDAAVKRINDAERVIGAKQIVPIRDAIARAGLNSGSSGPITDERLAKFATLLDTLVTVDSQGWSWNKYNYGSMTGVSVVPQTTGGAALTLRVRPETSGRIT
jgi:hypothetical protein